MSERPLPAVRQSSASAAKTLERELESAAGYAAKSLADATIKAYEHDWSVFVAWCAERNLSALPATPTIVAAFLAAEADREFRPVTITRRAAAIAYAHRASNVQNPCDSSAVARVLTGIRRSDETERRVLEALTLEPLEQLVQAIDVGTLQGLRDRALLLVGFAAALRRSELVALDVANLRFDVKKGLALWVRKSKTDQEKKGTTVAVPYAKEHPELCAVRALRTWLAEAGIHSGPVFRQMRRGDHVTANRLSDRSVALIIKKRAEGAHLPAENLSGHSLRAGYATAAAAAGIEERKIANVTRHKSMTVLRGYIRTAKEYDEVGQVL